MQRMRRDLLVSDELNSRLKAELFNMKRAVRDATLFAKSLIDRMRQQSLQGSGGAMMIPPDLEGMIPPGNWAGVRIPSQMGSADHQDARSGAALLCKTEIQQEDSMVNMQLVVNPTGFEGVEGVNVVPDSLEVGEFS